MNEKARKEQKIRRIVVAVDSSPASLTALEEAVALGADLGAKVVGLFVEDINLVRVAQLSVTYEVGTFSATSRRLEIQYVERQFRGQANRARRAMAVIAGEAGIDWDFRVTRGVVARELLAAASDADLLVIGRVGLSSPRKQRLGSTARALLQQVSQPTLLLHPHTRLGSPILLLYDGTVPAQRALAAAIQMLPGANTHLTVLLLGDGPEVVQQLRQNVVMQLKGQDIVVRFRWQTKMDVDKLARTVHSEGCQILVLPGDGARLGREAMLTLLEKADCPVLFVR